MVSASLWSPASCWLCQVVYSGLIGNVSLPSPTGKQVDEKVPKRTKVGSILPTKQCAKRRHSELRITADSGDNLLWFHYCKCNPAALAVWPPVDSNTACAANPIVHLPLEEAKFHFWLPSPRTTRCLQSDCLQSDARMQLELRDHIYQRIFSQVASLYAGNS